MRKLYITEYLLYDHRYFKIAECWKYISAELIYVYRYYAIAAQF